MLFIPRIVLWYLRSVTATLMKFLAHSCSFTINILTFWFQILIINPQCFTIINSNLSNWEQIVTLPVKNKSIHKMLSCKYKSLNSHTDIFRFKMNQMLLWQLNLNGKEHTQILFLFNKMSGKVIQKCSRKWRKPLLFLFKNWALNYFLNHFLNILTNNNINLKMTKVPHERQYGNF